MLHTAFLGLGSNMGDRHSLLHRAIELLEERVGRVQRVSSFIETKPWGFVSSYEFVNAVVVCDTSLTPWELLEETQRIEQELGRRCKSRRGQYQDRPIDIDILLYDTLVLEHKRLTIPHALMHKRHFVLRSMIELAPELIHPRLGLSMLRLMDTALDEIT